MATAAEIQTAYRALYRADLNATVASAIAGTGISVDAYIAQQLPQVATTTQAVVAIASFVTGTAPTSATLDTLTVDAGKQVASYTAMGSSHPELGAYEAFGRAFATDSVTGATFATKYGSLSSTDFINVVYAQVYGTQPNAAQLASLQGQIDYFTKLYAANNVANGAVAAKGAVLGQIVGYAFTSSASANSTLDNQVQSLLTSAAKGDTSVYNKALPTVSGSGTPGAILTLTGATLVNPTGADVVDPTATSLQFKSTDGDDTIRGINPGDLSSADVINGAGGTDTLTFTNTGGGAALAPVIKSVELINMTNAGGVQTVDFAAITGATKFTSVNSDAAAITLANITTDTTVAVKDGAGAANNLVVTLKDASGSNDTLKFVSESTSAGATVVSNVKVDGIENVQVSLVSDKATDAHTVNLQATGGQEKLSTVTVSGSGAATLVLDGNQDKTITSVDASALKGGLTFNASTTTKGVNIIGGSGDDTLTSSGLASSIKGGLGADAINLTAGGVHKVVYTSGADSTAVTTDTITGFVTGTDKIDLSAFAFATDKQTFSAASIAALPAGDVGAFFNVAGTNYTVVENAAHTYVAVDVNGDGNFTNGTDLLIKLAGAPTLVKADIAFS